MPHVHPACPATPKSVEKCLEKARSAASLLLMARFEGLAHSWLRLAEDLERAKALLERLKELRAEGQLDRHRRRANSDALLNFARW